MPTVAFRGSKAGNELRGDRGWWTLKAIEAGGYALGLYCKLKVLEAASHEDDGKVERRR